MPLPEDIPLRRATIVIITAMIITMDMINITFIVTIIIIIIITIIIIIIIIIIIHNCSVCPFELTDISVAILSIGYPPARYGARP